jgi:hypothetical protein
MLSYSIAAADRVLMFWCFSVTKLGCKPAATHIQRAGSALSTKAVHNAGKL